MKKLITPLIIVLLSTSCSSFFDTGKTDDDPVVEEKAIRDPNFSQIIRKNKSEVVYQDLFNLNNKISVSVDIDKSELDKIKEDNDRGFKPDMYRLAKKVTIEMKNGNNTFTWNFDNVGIRQKGNTSRGPIYKNNELNTENHYKLSFDETFTDISIYGESFVEQYGDETYEDRDFLGLSGLDFKWNRNLDMTHIKEIYSSELYRSSGIINQHVGLSNLKINYDNKTADFGLCFMYEQTSKSIIKRALSSSDTYINMPKWNEEKSGSYGVSSKKYGDYYKVTYGRGDTYSNDGGDLSIHSINRKRVGVRTDIYGNQIPAYERKTNTDSNYDDSLFKNAVNVICNNDYEEIDKVVDLKYFAINEAVGYFTGNPDSMRYNYNNYMIYLRRVDGKMIFVPIDNDRTFGIGHTWDKGITFSTNESTSPLSKKDVNNNDNKNVLYKKTILSTNNNESKETYIKYIDLIIKSPWVKNETFESLFNIAKKTYGDEYEFDLNGGPDNMSFENYIKTKIDIAKLELELY